MNEWEAKYKALLMAIDNPEYIENAEKMVEAAQHMAATGTIPFSGAVWSMIQLVQAQQLKDTKAELLEAKLELHRAEEKVWGRVKGPRP